MTEQWFFSRNNENFGPYSWNELLSMAQEAKQLLPSDQVWNPIEQSWIQADQLHGLFTPSPIPFAGSSASPNKTPLIILGLVLCLTILGIVTYAIWNSQPKTTYLSGKAPTHQSTSPVSEKSDLSPSKETKEEEKEEKPPVPVIQKQEPFNITIPSSATFNYQKERHFLIAKYENETHVIYDIDISNGKETIEHVVQGKSERSFSSSSPCIELSNDGKTLAIDSSNGLIVMDRASKQESMIDPYHLQEQQNKYTKKYFHLVKWSFDNRYLLYLVRAMEAHQIQIYDLFNKEKIIPEGNGYLNSAYIQWSPKENRYLDASESDVYDNIPGLYLSKPGQVEEFENIAPQIGMPSHVFEQAVFFPEGKKIAFLSALPKAKNGYLDPSDWQDNKQLMMYDLQTQQLKQVEANLNSRWISFSPDGSSLLYHQENGNELQIFSFDLATQKKRHIVSLTSSNTSITSIQIHESLWINQDQLVFVLDERIDINDPSNSKIIAIDLEQQSLLYSSNPFDGIIKLLSVNNQAI